jgi:glycerol-3-phosphate cytidylyltransferase-like family protein
MSTRKSSFITDEQRHEIATALKPVLASINTAREYMGNPSRSKFYADILPELETIKFKENDKRRWVVVASMDRLIETKRNSAPDND